MHRMQAARREPPPGQVPEATSPRGVVGPQSLRENSTLLSFRGAEGDEESRTAFVFRARFLAALGLTVIRVVLTQALPGLPRLRFRRSFPTACAVGHPLTPATRADFINESLRLALAALPNSPETTACPLLILTSLCGRTRTAAQPWDAIIC